jgi:hypothetical protein
VTPDRFVRMPTVGPRLMCRPLDGSPVPDVDAWSLTMGDVELF